MDEQALEALRALGLSGTEARLYATLIGSGSLTGYEAAKRSGVPRPNAYPALRKLIDRGAVRVRGQDDRLLYTAVEPGELGRLTLDRVSQAVNDLERLEVSPQKPIEAAVGQGYRALMAKAQAMVAQAGETVHAAVFPEEARALSPAIHQAIGRGISVRVLCLAGCAEDCGACLGRPPRLDPPSTVPSLLLCRDRIEVLAGSPAEELTTSFVITTAQPLAHALATLVETANAASGNA